MPWSGSGTYNLPPAYSPEVNGTVIDAVRYNGLTSDVATGITAALAKNGENTPTANLPMGGFKHTGAADGNAAGQYLTFGNATASLGNINLTAATVPANGWYLPSANTLGVSTNSTQRATIGSTGGWTIVPPTSAVTNFNVGTPFSSGSVALVAGDTTTNARTAAQLGGVSIAIGQQFLANTPEIWTGDADGLNIGTVSGGGTLAFWTNLAARATVTNAGNWTVNAPTSGPAMVVNRATAGSVTDSALRFPNNTVVTWLDSAAGLSNCGFIWYDSTDDLRFGTGNSSRMVIDTNGAVTINQPSAGNNTLIANAVGNGEAVLSSGDLTGSVYHYIHNTHNAGNVGGALSIMGVGGASAGDPGVRFDIDGANNWIIGVDNSDSDSFKISNSTTLGASDKLVVTTDGRLYGTALHNTGTVTGTTNQYVASGTYTPTLTNTTNISTSSAAAAQWMRVGNVVTVSGEVDIDPTAGSAVTVLDMSLPIASNFSLATQCCGTAVRNNTTLASVPGTISGEPAGDTARLVFFCDTDAAQRPWYYTYTYLVN